MSVSVNDNTLFLIHILMSYKVIKILRLIEKRQVELAVDLPKYRMYGIHCLIYFCDSGANLGYYDSTLLGQQNIWFLCIYHRPLDRLIVESLREMTKFQFSHL